jgi:CRISPR-associated endonuclease/helicase Cas3
MVILFLQALVDAYKEICNAIWYGEERIKISDALSEIQPGKVTIVRLPTGYGKSAITLALLYYISKGNFEFGKSVIHVLPMRTIIEDLFQRIIVDTRNLGINNNLRIKAQYMSELGSPFFFHECVITTVDTFLMNFYKIPAVEFEKFVRFGFTHFELARSQIYTSSVIFDEFHLFTPSLTNNVRECESNIFHAAVACIACLASSGVPVVLMTATMPTATIDSIVSTLKERNVSSSLVDYNADDESFERRERKIYSSILDAKVDDVAEVVKKNGHGKIIVVMNTPNRAVRVYRSLDDRVPKFLIHGKVDELKRKELWTNIKKALDDSRDVIVVSTQVIESGVDVSFDYMVTDGCPADRLIQRAGRVARKDEKSVGDIVILHDRKGYCPYDEKIVELTIEKVEANGFPTEFGIVKRFVDSVYPDHEITGSIASIFFESLDEYVASGPKISTEYLNKYGSFARCSGLVKGFPPNVDNSKKFVPIDEDEAIELFTKHNRRLVKVRADGKLVFEQTDFTFRGRGSFSFWLTEKGYEGIELPSYDEEIGYVPPM